VERFGGRAVLDQLHQVVLIDHLARRGGDVPADVESVGIGHLDREVSLAALQVVQQVSEPFQQVLPTGFRGRAQHVRVGHREIRRRHRVQELTCVKVDLRRGLFVQSLDVTHRVAHPGRCHQIALLDVIEDQVFLPVRSLEASIVGGRRHHRRRVAAEHPVGGRLPEIEIALPERHLPLRRLGRIGEIVPGHLHEGGADIHRVGHPHGVIGIVSGDEIRDQFLAFLRDVLNHLGDPFRVRYVVL